MHRIEARKTAIIGPGGLARWRIALIAVAAAAVIIRVLYLAQIANSPCAALHRASETDMAFFDGWARAIVAGDVLSSRVEPPRHDWHDIIAREYFDRYPDQARGYAARAARDRVTPAGLLWRDWVGGGRFYQEPLYPYLIALTYAVLGPDPRWMFALQMLLGAASVILVFLVTRRAFGERTGVVAAATTCFGGPWIYLEAVLVRTSFLVFAGLGLALLLQRADERWSFERWFALGAVAGASILLQAYFAFFLAAAAAFIVVDRLPSPRPVGRGRSLAGLAAGAALALLPLVARNVAVGVPPLGLASAAGVNLIVANAFQPGMDATSFRIGHVPGIMSATHGAPFATALAVLKTYPSPWAFVAGAWQKLVAVGWWYEMPDNTNFYYFRLHAGVLRALFVNFTVVGALGAVGFVMAVRRSSRARLALHFLAGLSLVMILGFVVRDRFRASLAVALVPFAAWALVGIFDRLRARSWARAAVLVVPAALLAAAMARPLPEGLRAIRSTDYWLPFEVYHVPKAGEAAGRGDWRRAADIFAESLRREPEWLAAIGPARPARAGADADIASAFADMRDVYARALDGARDRTAAERERRRAAELRVAAGVSTTER